MVTISELLHGPRQEFELALGTGKLLSDLSDTCIRAVRNNLAFDAPSNGDRDVRLRRLEKEA